MNAAEATAPAPKFHVYVMSRTIAGYLGLRGIVTSEDEAEIFDTMAGALAAIKKKGWVPCADTPPEGATYAYPFGAPRAAGRTPGQAAKELERIQLRAAVREMLDRQSTRTLRALWSRTVKHQEERGCPRTKADMIDGLADYYDTWQNNDVIEVFENLIDAKDFGAESLTATQVKMLHRDKATIVLGTDGEPRAASQPICAWVARRLTASRLARTSAFPAFESTKSCTP